MLLSRVLPKPTSILRASQLRTLRLPQTVTFRASPSFPRNPLLQTFIMSIHMKGRCVCKNLQYSLELDSLDDARTTLCHCNSCKRAFGTNYGLTTKVPLKGFKYETGTPKKFKQHNGVTREFCDDCGAYICEYGVRLFDKVYSHKATTHAFYRKKQQTGSGISCGGPLTSRKRCLPRASSFARTSPSGCPIFQVWFEERIPG